MKKLLIMMLLFSSISILAQDTDPLKDVRDLVESSEMIVVWSESVDQFNLTIRNHYQKVYDYFNPPDTINFLPIDERIVPKQKFESADNLGVFGNHHVEVAVGDFNGDGYKEYVSAWEGPGARINISVAEININNLSTIQNHYYITDSVLVDDEGNPSRRIHLATGDFDGDLQDEFILAYQGHDEMIHIQLFDTDGGLTPIFKTEISDELLPAVPVKVARLGIAADDFDNDGRAEIILTSQDPDAGGTDRWMVYAKVYDVNSVGGYTIIPKAKQNLHLEPLVQNGFEAGPINLGVTTGSYNRDFKKDAAVIVSIFQGDITGDDTFLYLLNISEDLNTIQFGDTTKAARALIGPNEMEPLTIKSGDLNGDGIDEVVFAVGPYIFIYSSDENLKPTYKSQSNIGYSDDQFSYNYIDIGDLDRDGKAEIVTVYVIFPGEPNSFQTLEITAYEANSSLSTITVKGEMNLDEPVDGHSHGRHRSFAIAVGDFDGDRVRLGKPKRYFDYEISQPLVILNSPPIHYDILDGITYDVNGCFSGSSCDFSATYFKSTTVTGEMSTTVNTDWGVDTTIEGDVNIYGNAVNRTMNNTYGEGFSYDKSKRETFKISFSATAVSEDLIFGTVIDYILWEYPIIVSDTVRGHLVVVEPKPPVKTWYSTESWPGFSYIPNHEVGNIFSYQEYNDLTSNDYLMENIKVDNGVRFGLSPTSSYSWEVDWSSWSGTSTSSSMRIASRTGFSWSAGLDIDFFGSLKSTYGEQMESTYSEEQVSTHTSTVEQAFNIKVELGTISDGDKRYDVTPYAYWAKNGSVVVDYAARPQLAPQGQPPTWWQQQYGQEPDPAFILPFRYHVEKGLSLPGDEKKHLTRDIAFFPDNVQPGERVTIAARIHNFSLLDTQNPLKIRFYLGDPDNGGTPIVGTNGETYLVTSDFLPFRGSSIVQMDWNTPGNLPAYPRIYAVIDPDNEITAEIHEENNKGYNVLGTAPPTGVNDGDPNVLSLYTLDQNYPNPFNPVTRIRYAIPQTANVEMKVFDVLGREVETLVSELKSPGQYEVNFDGGNLASGIYFYRIEAGEFITTKKMILMK